MSPPLLSVRGLAVAFRTRAGGVQALHGMSFDLRPGEMLGIVGESGSGKSATALALMGLLGPAGRVTAGQAFFAGRDLLAMGEGALARLRGAGLAMVFQNPRAALNPVRPVGSQLADVIARHHPGGSAEIRARMLEALRQMRIPDPERRAKALPHELSGGLCQRIGIALAMAGDPRLLIADEPTTGLDVTTQAAVMDLLREALRARGAGSLLITHDLALAAQYCDRILVMQAGRVVEKAPVGTLFTVPRHPHTLRLLRGMAAAAGRLEDLLPEEGELPEPPSAATGRGAPLLSLRGLRKAFPLRRPGLFRPRPRLLALDGLDLDIHPGEAVGLVGESGCGKSTLARLVNRLAEPDAGEVLLEGQPIQAIPPGAFAASPQRRAIQMVFQDPVGSLNPRFTAFDCIADPLRQLLPAEGAATRRARVEAAAARVGLPPALLPRYPHQLSGGEKARVGIARAMAVEPRLLVLDEPTAALDAPLQALVLRLLARLRREAGVALLFISHDLHLVRLLCDRVAVMHLGQVVEEGPTRQVLASPRHPYTAALLSALPHPPGAARPRPLRLEGEPRSPVDPDPRACRLHGRCPRGTGFCATNPPAWRVVVPGQQARCHFPLDGTGG
ncbi:ABC transporter ATP-binding protein [Roseomonas sp. ACRSG]|nr:ABC transporter ATP-binding protein [Roseomonas sp. ACRSG]